MRVSGFNIDGVSTGMRTALIAVSIVAVGVVLVGGAAIGQTPAIPKGDIIVDLEFVCGGLTAPVYATHAGDGSGRLFVVDQVGQIWIWDGRSHTCLSEAFLDLSGGIVDVNTSFDERGLLGLAFHPRYETNRRFFVRYSAPREGVEGEPCFATSRGCHESIVAEFRALEAEPDRADPASERVLFRIDQPQFNHNAGNVAFGPDGLLYFTLGDGGGAHDGLADEPPSHGGIGNGQNIETALGAVLRIDVDGRRDPGLQYAVPRSNPFAGATPGVDEIFAYGLRNPYRFSFDDGPGGSGELFLADVGQNLFEEINIIEKRGNYGWVAVEGFHCFDPLDPTVPPSTCSGEGPHGEPLLNPIAEYQHSDGIAVIGGFVYRGSSSLRLFGKYVFGDFSRGFVPGNGRLFWLDTKGARSTILEFQIGDADDALDLYLLGLGEDEAGEIYVLTSPNLGPTGLAGEVWRLKARDDLGRRVEVCHGGRTIRLGHAAAYPHLVHGDDLGPCLTRTPSRKRSRQFAATDPLEPSQGLQK